MFALADNNMLYHHGIKGMKWGVRRFQNKDGSLTLNGKKRYSRDEYLRDRNRLYEQVESKYIDSRKYHTLAKEADKIASKWNLDRDDGGGGKTNTPQSERDRYIDLSNKAAKEYDRIYTPEVRVKIGKEVTNKLLDIYGKEGVERFNHDERKNLIIGGTVAATACLTIIGSHVLVYKAGKWILQTAVKKHLR